jgi:ketosteroid isomerase-like protein
MAFLAAMTAIFLAFALAASTPGPAAAVAAVLDDMHDAAAKADEKRYFSHYAPDAVFLGTDATERWTTPAFKEYAHPHFASGKGWTFTPRTGRRNVALSADGNTAWFDEIVDSESYGECRGTGVLSKQKGGRWLIAHYHLTIPVPNALAKEVVKMIRAQQAPKP